MSVGPDLFFTPFDLRRFFSHTYFVFIKYLEPVSEVLMVQLPVLEVPREGNSLLFLISTSEGVEESGVLLVVSTVPIGCRCLLTGIIPKYQEIRPCCFTGKYGRNWCTEKRRV